MTKYTPTLHAIERAHHRLGVEPAQAAKWFNEAMRKAKYLFTQTVRGNTQAVYEIEDARIVVDTSAHKIVTIKPALDTSVLKPVFEREHRRIKREVTRNVRQIELTIAELTVEMGERMMAYARAKNPQTRAIIQRDIDDLQAKINAEQSRITTEQDRLDNFVRATGIYV